MSATNEKIQNLILQFEKDTGVRIDQLSMVLNGVVDAAVNGGIANYKVCFIKLIFKEYGSIIILFSSQQCKPWRQSLCALKPFCLQAW